MKFLFKYAMRKPLLVHNLLFLCCIYLFLASTHANATLNPIKSSDLLVQAPSGLKVGEGFVNPIGYYEQKPRFSWQIAVQSTTQRQTAYQVQVSSSTNFSDAAMLWDSKKTLSEQNAWVRYQGEKLQSRQKVFWRVRIWDQDQQVSNWSQTNTIEMGIVDNDEWQAQWIGHPEPPERTEDSVFFSSVKSNRFPVPDVEYYRPFYLRTGFQLQQNVKQARLHITAKGVFKPFINGMAISDDTMTPGWTPYHKRIETLTYDVTDFLQNGNNALGVAVAEGWHSGRIFHPTVQQPTLPMRLLAQLEIELEDGTTQVIASDKNWLASNRGPIREASNYDGEYYDANYDLPNWNAPNFIAESSAKWQAALVEPLDPSVTLQPKRHWAVSTTATIAAQNIVSNRNGVVIFDMGQNLVGVPEINVPAVKGQRIKLRFAEALEGEKFAVENLRSAKNTDYYVPNTTGTITYQPTFTFHGYRYVELSGHNTLYSPSTDWIESKVLHSNFTVYDNFNSDHPLLNKLSNNVEWGLRGNFLDIPTDCPQRDERLGWTGDAQVFVQASMYKADVYSFWSAWLQSVREEQGIDGLVPNYVPFRSFLKSLTGAAWGDAATIVPWELYQFTGDTAVLEENYNMMKRWVGYHTYNSYQHISNMGSHGDWLQPFTIDGTNGGDTHRDLIATAYYAHSTHILAKSAKLLGYQADAQYYQTLFEQIREKFRHYFFDQNMDLHALITKPPVFQNGSERKSPPKTFSPISTQTTYLLPLAFELLGEKDQLSAVDKLVSLIEKSDRHLRTGFLGTPLLAPVLQKFGHSDLMYDLLFQETYPSWFYSIKNGATTMWERWNSYSLQDGFNGEKMNSLNHYAYGAVASWFYRGILGIQPTQPGFKYFIFNPQLNKKLGQVSGSHPTPQGDIQVLWQIHKQTISLSLTVPKNTQASLSLPHVNIEQILFNGQTIDTNQVKLQPGLYEIKGKLLAGVK